jgi:hypothetical protein
MATFWTYLKTHTWQRRALTGLLMVCLGGLSALMLQRHVRRNDLLESLCVLQGAALNDAAQRAYREASQSESFRQRLADLLTSESSGGFRASLHVLIALRPEHPDVTDKIIAALERMGPQRQVRALEILIGRVEDGAGLLQQARSVLESLPDGRFYPLAVRMRRKDLLSEDSLGEVLVDRFRRIRFEAQGVEAAPQSVAQTRLDILRDLILSPRENPQVTRILSMAAVDPSDRVRAEAAVLAGRLGNLDVLLRLLKEGEPAVAAALCVGAEGIGSLSPRLAELLRTHQEPEVVWACAWALARMDIQAWDKQIASRLRSSQGQMRDWLVPACVAGAGPAMREAIADMLEGPDLPQAVALSAGSRLGLPQSGPAARRVLQAVLAGREASMAQLIAALETAARCDEPLRREVYSVLRGLWSVQTDFAMYRAAEALGRQAVLDAGQAPDAPSREECIAVLLRAARWAQVVSEGQTGDVVRTPGASAAAAACAWQLQPTSRWFEATEDRSALPFTALHDSTAYGILQAAGVEESLPVDIVSWKLSRSDFPEALELALHLLPRRDDPNTPSVYDRNVLVCGAMTACLWARDKDVDSRDRARQRVLDRMSTRFGLTEDLILLVNCRAALAVLGDREHLDAVLSATQESVLPMRRGLTILQVCRDRRGLDWLLFDASLSDAEVENLLLDREFDEVLAQTLPRLPRPWPSAGSDQRAAQIRLLRQVYLVQRQDLQWGG